MELSAYCLIIGVLEMLFAGPALLYPERSKQWAARLMREEALMRLMGAALLILSVFVLARGGAITADLPGIVRLCAWIGAVKSLALAWWPGRSTQVAETFFAFPGMVRLYGPLALAAGIFFLWASFVLA